MPPLGRALPTLGALPTRPRSALDDIMPPLSLAQPSGVIGVTEPTLWGTVKAGAAEAVETGFLPFRRVGEWTGITLGLRTPEQYAERERGYAEMRRRRYEEASHPVAAQLVGQTIGTVAKFIPFVRAASLLTVPTLGRAALSLAERGGAARLAAYGVQAAKGAAEFGLAEAGLGAIEEGTTEAAVRGLKHGAVLGGALGAAHPLVATVAGKMFAKTLADRGLAAGAINRITSALTDATVFGGLSGLESAFGEMNEQEGAQAADIMLNAGIGAVFGLVGGKGFTKRARALSRVPRRGEEEVRIEEPTAPEAPPRGEEVAVPLQEGPPVSGYADRFYRTIDSPDDALKPNVSMQAGPDPFAWGINGYTIEIVRPHKTVDTVSPITGREHHPGMKIGTFDPLNVTRVFYEPEFWASEYRDNRLAQDLPKLRRMFPNAEFVRVRIRDDATSWAPVPHDEYAKLVPGIGTEARPEVAPTEILPPPEPPGPPPIRGGGMATPSMLGTMRSAAEIEAEAVPTPVQRVPATVGTYVTSPGKWRNRLNVAEEIVRHFPKYAMTRGHPLEMLDRTAGVLLGRPLTMEESGKERRLWHLRTASTRVQQFLVGEPSNLYGTERLTYTEKDIDPTSQDMMPKPLPNTSEVLGSYKGKRTQIEDYLWLRTVKERYLDQKRDPGVPASSIYKGIADYEAAYPDIKRDASKVFLIIRKFRDDIVGQVEPEARDLFEKFYDEYVPNRLALPSDELRQRMGWGSTDYRNLWARTKGNVEGHPTKNIFEVLPRIMDQMLSVAQKSDIVNTLEKLKAQVKPDDVFARFGVAGATDEVKVKTIAVGVRTELGRLKGFSVTDKTLQDFVSYLLPVEYRKDGFASIKRFEEGKLKEVDIPIDVWEAINAIDRKTWHPVFQVLLEAPVRIAKIGLTGNRLDFAAYTNIGMDAQNLAQQRQGPGYKGWNPLKHYKSAGEMYNAYQKMLRSIFVSKVMPNRDQLALHKWFDRVGLEFSTFYGADPRSGSQVAKRLFNPNVRHPIEYLKNVLSFSQVSGMLSQAQNTVLDMVRAGEIKSFSRLSPDELRKVEINRDDVVLNGKKIADVADVLKILTPVQHQRLFIDTATVINNYRDAGSVGEFLNRIRPFVNANILSARMAAKSLADNPARGVILGTTLFTIPTLVTWWKYKDEEWYQKRTGLQRALYFPIEIGNQVWNIPKATIWGQLFSTIPDLILNYMHDEDPELTRDYVKGMLKTISPLDIDPLNPLEAIRIPYATEMAVEQYANWKFFTDRPILTQEELAQRPQSQFGPYTTVAAKALGGGLAWTDEQIKGMIGAELIPEWFKSPKRIDSFARSLFGGAVFDYFNYAERALQGAGLLQTGRKLEITDWPILDRALQRGGLYGGQSRFVNELYDDIGLLSAYQRDKNYELSTDQANYLRRAEVARDNIRALQRLQTDVGTGDQAATISRNMSNIAKSVTKGRSDLSYFAPISGFLSLKKQAASKLDDARDRTLYPELEVQRTRHPNWDEKRIAKQARTRSRPYQRLDRYAERLRRAVLRKDEKALKSIITDLNAVIAGSVEESRP